MIVQKTKHTKTLSRTAQLMGGVSIAVLMAYGPANAQAVNITVDGTVTPTADAFTAANVTGFDTVANSTQESRAAVTASIDDGVLNSDIAGSGSSSVGIQSNALTATASGNVFSLDADQLGTTGDGTSGTLGALSGQFADDTVSTSITGSSLTIDGTGDADATSLAASENAISATTTGNNATVVFSDDISADLAGDLAQSGTGFITGPITLTRDDLDTETLSVDGASSVVASTQALAGTALASSANIENSTISVSLATNGSDDSAVSVEGNQLRSTLSGNIASTGTNVTVDTAFDGSAGVFTQQQIGDGANATLAASTDSSVLSVTLVDSTDSSLTVSDNVLGASARGNLATLDGGGVGGNLANGTSLSITANSIISDAAGGQIDIANAGTVGFADATTPANVTNFGFVAASQQSIEGAGAGSITASNNANSLTVDAAGTLDGSSLTVEDNTAFALASGNTGGTAIDLNATSITASAGLALDQNVAGTDVIADLGGTNAFILSADVGANLTNSSLAVDSNLSVAEANGNIGRTLLSADADTALLSSSTLDLGSGVIDTDSATTSTEADFAVAANQSTGADAITATATSALDATVGNAAGTGLIADSSVSLSRNVQQATAGGNTLTNGIDLDGNVIGSDLAGAFGDNIAVVTSLTSLQNNASAITGTSATTLSVTQEGLNGTSVSGSSLDVNANENRATATANRATSTLAVTADTAIIAADATAASADFASATDITTVGGTNSLANVQDSSGAIGVTTTTAADITAGGGISAALLGSSASISKNIVTASGSANIGTSTIDINAGTETTTNAALANVQSSSSAVTAGATLDAENISGSLGQGVLLTGPLVNSTVGIDDNVIVSSGMGNQVTSTLSVAANRIDRTASTATASNALSGATPDVAADFASLNVQDQTANITSGATAGGTILLSETVAGNGSGSLLNSSVTLNANQLQSDAMSNLATNSIDLTGASAITATTAGLGSVQTSGATGAAITVTSDANATFSAGTKNSAVTDSTVSIDGNQAFDSATSNRVANAVSLAGNSITGQAGGLADVAVTPLPQGSATALADNSLSSVQTSFATVDSGSTITGTISTGTGRVFRSSVSVSDNFARSFGMGNTGVNSLGLLADTSFSGTSALTGTQIQVGDVGSSASVTAPVTVLSLITSTASIDENIAFSRSMGNDQTNTLSAEGTSIAGVSGAGVAATFTELGAAGTTPRTLDADTVLTASQVLSSGDVTGAATVTGSIDTTGIITNSSVSASDNIAQSNVTGSRGSNLLELAAETSVTGVSVLTSEQLGTVITGETKEIISTADLTFGIEQTGAFAPINSALNVDGNLGFSSAFGNDVTNGLDVSGTSVVGQNNAALSTIDISTTGVVNGTASNLLGNFQSRTAADPSSNTVSSSADLTINLLNTATGATGNSTITAADNILDSTATSNRASNALVLNADTTLTAGGAIANRQASDSPVVSDVALRTTVGGASLGSVTGSSIALLDNTGIARVAGNDAVNVLNARAGTAITGVAGSGSSTVGTGGLLNASGTFATASNQVNSGAVTARASFSSANPTESSFGVQTAALNSSSVDLSGNRLVADAVSNRVNNTISVSGRSSSTNVSTALTTRQIASGNVTSRVDTFNLASANGALDASSVGLSGNTFSASAGGNSAVSRLIRD